MTKVKSRRKRLVALAVVGAILGVILIAVGIHAIRWAVHNKTADNYGEYNFNGGQTQFSLDLFPSIVIDEHAQSIKVMQIADPQIKFGSLTRDTKTMDLLDRAIRTEQPDICVVTGDLTLSVFTYDAFKYFADFMEERSQYWAFVYGNHDSQFDCSKYTIHQLLTSSKYSYLYGGHCLFQRGASDIYGESNYLINVFKGERRAENLAYSLVMMDSGMYPEAENVALSDWVYDWIHQSQMDWYSWAIRGLQGVKADIQTSMYFHIPIKEFANMYYLDRIKNYGSTVPNEQQIRDSLEAQGITADYIRDVTGVVCESDKKDNECVYGDDGYTVGIYYQGNAEGAENDHPNVFKYVKDLGSTTAIFCGHDHVNTLKGYYDDVYLGYGLCCGYHTYPFFNSEFFLTKWLGLSDKILYNGDLWVDGHGNKLEKGVTVIEVGLTAENYGSLTVADKPDSAFK